MNTLRWKNETFVYSTSASNQYDVFNVYELYDKYMVYAKILKLYVTDTVSLLHKYIREGKRLFVREHRPLCLTLTLEVIRM